MNYDEDCFHKSYALFILKEKRGCMFRIKILSDKQRVCYQKNIILDLLLKKSNSFKWNVSLLFFVFNINTLSSHMSQMSKHVNSSNHKSHSYDKMNKLIITLGSKKCKNNKNSSSLTHQYTEFFTNEYC